MFENIDAKLGEDIWKARLTRKDIDLCFKHTPDFWKDVIDAWCTFCSEDEWSKNHLWNNSKIRVGDKPVFYEKAYLNGLETIQQLFEGGKAITFEEAHRLFGLSVMEYNSIICAVPPSIKTSTSGTSVLILETTPSAVYRHVNSGSFPTSLVNKWEEKLQEEISYLQFLSHLKGIYRVTNLPKLCSFQYRLLHRAIITNKDLFKWGKAEHDLCGFCGECAEDYIHLFCQCRKVEELWQTTRKWLTDSGFELQDISFNVMNILFCDLHPKRGHLTNFLALVVKQYIYRKRCLGQDVSKIELKTEFLKCRNIEKAIAVKNNKLYIHEKKWFNA